jgi:hypothetical protein
MLKQIQKASNKTTSTSSVKYYTIPTDTQMPKSDVIYDTIGFQGDVGSGGATFKLYYDTEKTGAKTYHIWFKQLAGSGKLTLTTGVSGASNLVMNAGTYVAIIYVDQDGNVLSQGATPTSTIAMGNTQPPTSQAVYEAIQQGGGTDIKVYDNYAQAEADLANLEVDQFVATEDGQLFSTTDTVASGNMNPVTSNAVANAFGYLVWENPDSTVDFSAQTITFDRAVPNEYTRLKVEFRNYKTQDYMFTTEVDIGMNTYLSSSFVTSGGEQWVTSRLFRNITRTQADVDICRTYSSSYGFQDNVTRCIPHKIWAIK